MELSPLVRSCYHCKRNAWYECLARKLQCHHDGMEIFRNEIRSTYGRILKFVGGQQNINFYYDINVDNSYIENVEEVILKV
jgi:hypothetical protein